MTARDFLLRQIEDAGNRLAHAIEGVDSSSAESKPNDETRTIRQQVAHLAEASLAVTASFEGREHAWGTWQPQDRSWEGVKRAWHENRSQAVAALPEDDASLLSAAHLLVAHDAYHAGQIVAARRAAHPEWNAYSLYTEPQSEAL